MFRWKLEHRAREIDGTRSSRKNYSSANGRGIRASIPSMEIGVTPGTVIKLSVGFLALLCVDSARAGDQAPGTMAARVEACAACHGAEGRGTNDPYFPRLISDHSCHL
jgi:cytochrome c553